MDKHKIVWRVSEAPTGPYAWVHPRGWPRAYYAFASKEVSAAYITCEKTYVPALARRGDHPPLKLHIAKYAGAANGTFKWFVAKKRPATLAEAKELLAAVLKAHPDFLPTEIRNG